MTPQQLLFDQIVIFFNIKQITFKTDFPSDLNQF
jgi:hypothetical protein